jgi:hypothetical protein
VARGDIQPECVSTPERASNSDNCAHDAVVTREGPHPPAELEPSLPGATILIRAGRATHVP